jgi:molecular chaperone DnaK (HSP70)
LIDTETNTIWDWKTITKNSIAYFGSRQQLMQIQLYGWLANQNGITIDRVGLVGIPRDGNESDIIELSWAYDENIALEAIARYEEIKEQFEPPAPEKDAKFCANYCPFFGACSGIVEPTPTDVISNMEIATLAEDYVTIAATVKALQAQQDYIKEQLDGTTGTTGTGTVIKWLQVSGRQSIDEAEVEKLLGFVPKKQGNGYSRLVIK